MLYPLSYGTKWLGKKKNNLPVMAKWDPPLSAEAILEAKVDELRDHFLAVAKLQFFSLECKMKAKRGNHQLALSVYKVVR